MSDAPFLPDIERAAGTLFAQDQSLALVDFDDVWDQEDHLGFIAQGHCLVAEIGSETIGFLAATPKGRELHIVEMSVHPKVQQQGIGAGLIRAAMIDAHNCGFRALTLTTFVDFPWNAPFYSRLGFQRISDISAHPRLARVIEEEVAAGLPRERRVAMTCPLS